MEATAEPITLDLLYPSNWSAEGSVELLYLDASSGAETSYGELAQGGSKSQESFVGHRWLLREKTSRELLMSVVAARAPDGSRFQHVVVRSDCADPLRAAVWRLGSSPREVLLPTSALLIKIVSNITANPAEPKYRTINAIKMASALNVPGVLALLTNTGFEQHVDGDVPRLILAPTRPTAPLHDALGLLRRLDAILNGRPLPQESLTSMQATQQAAQAARVSSSAADAPSHRCESCGNGIENDLRRKLAGSGEIGGWRTHDAVGSGEYRFHCDRCNVDLCAKCYDRYKGGEATHDHSHQLTIIAPITTPWGGSSYGPPPAPPAFNPSKRRGPWG